MSYEHIWLYVLGTVSCSILEEYEKCLIVCAFAASAFYFEE